MHNTTFSNWDSSCDVLRAYTMVNGVPQRVGTGLIPAANSIAPGEWYQFDVKMNAMPVGTTALYYTMADYSVPPNEGEFWYDGTDARADVVDIAPSSALGAPAYTPLDGGFVNPYSGNFHYETTDLEIPGAGPEVDHPLVQQRGHERRLVRPRVVVDVRDDLLLLEFTYGGVTLVHPDGRRELYTWIPYYGIYLADRDTPLHHLQHDDVCRRPQGQGQHQVPVPEGGKREQRAHAVRRGRAGRAHQPHDGRQRQGCDHHQRGERPGVARRVDLGEQPGPEHRVPTRST